MCVTFKKMKIAMSVAPGQFLSCSRVLTSLSLFLSLLTEDKNCALRLNEAQRDNGYTAQMANTYVII